jgi:hypothetical protein
MEKWVAEAKKNLADGKEVSDPPSVAPHPNENFRGRCEVSCLYNGMINPLTRMALPSVVRRLQGKLLPSARPICEHFRPCSRLLTFR